MKLLLALIEDAAEIVGLGLFACGIAAVSLALGA